METNICWVFTIPKRHGRYRPTHSLYYKGNNILNQAPGINYHSQRTSEYLLTQVKKNIASKREKKKQLVLARFHHA